MADKQIRIVLTVDSGSAEADLKRAKALTADLGSQGKASAAQLSAFKGTLDNLGISAGQYKQAMRQLPAQITDIVTSLAGGQSVFQVAIQQGGQIKDSFGGIGPAARALVGALNPVTLALFAATAGAGAVVVAIIQAQREQESFNRALILTGNYAGVSASQLSRMAVSIDEIAGTRSQASEVLATLAATGRVGGDQLQRFAEIAIEAERTLGLSVKTIVKDFSELSNSPTAAALKLDETLHFLSVSTLEQIRALEQQGRVTDAARIASDTYADAIGSRASDMQRQLGFVERSWRGVKDAAAEAWDAILDIGRPSDKSWTDSKVARDLLPTGRPGYQSQLNSLRAGTPGVTPAAISDEYKKATVDIDRISDQALTSQQRLNRELENYRTIVATIRRESPDDPRVSAGRVASTEAAIRARSAAARDSQRQIKIEDADASDRLRAAAQIEDRENTAAQQRQIKNVQLERMIELNRELSTAEKEQIEQDVANSVFKPGSLSSLTARGVELEDQRRQQSDSTRADESEARAVLNRLNPSTGRGELARGVRESGSDGGEALRRERDAAKLDVDNELRENLSALERNRQTNLEINARYDELVLRAHQDHTDKKKAIDDAYSKTEEVLRQDKLRVTADFFGNLSTVARAFGEKGFKAYKALAITQAIIDTYASAVSAFKSLAPIPYVGPILGAAAAAAAVASGMAQVSAIRSQTYSGREFGGPVFPREKRRVAERGRPELLDVGDETFLITGSQGGSVRPAKRGSSGGGGDGGTTLVQPINIINNASGVQASTRTESDGSLTVLIEAVAADIANGGKVGRAVSARTGTRQPARYS